jgi:hypothetical protein
VQDGSGEPEPPSSDRGGRRHAHPPTDSFSGTAHSELAGARGARAGRHRAGEPGQNGPRLVLPAGGLLEGAAGARNRDVAQGEVGAGVLVVSLGYGLGGPMMTVAMLSLALNLVLTGVFILVVQRLLIDIPHLPDRPA